MGDSAKPYEHIMVRRSDSNIPFNGLCTLRKRLGFEERVRGDLHLFTTGKVEEILPLQCRGGKAEAYQVKQVRNVILAQRR
ncbi:type II toxin-antitoxin system HicA family toxin [Candidatus Bipolaricaulota bacterium]|nr:type II toxin-antitoxin system HicA family toxin [Candidatus Bipolaricaulota bacterium]